MSVIKKENFPEIYNRLSEKKLSGEKLTVNEERLLSAIYMVIINIKKDKKGGE